jgi:hypothetical protein
MNNQTSPTVTAVSELKPCPFCGSPASIEQVSNDDSWWIIRCTDQADDAAMACSACPEVQEDNREIAIAHWNHREPAARSALADVGECELCKGTGDSRCIPHPPNVAWNRTDMGCRKCGTTGKQPRPAAEANNYHDAYRGARDDLLYWKRRALEAEATSNRLAEALAKECNGPTFMGEPLSPAAHTAQLTEALLAGARLLDRVPSTRHGEYAATLRRLAEQENKK